jgi:hypothetical protein
MARAMTCGRIKYKANNASRPTICGKCQLPSVASQGRIEKPTAVYQDPSGRIRRFGWPDPATTGPYGCLSLRRGSLYSVRPMTLREKIATRRAGVGVIGLGYVGLPLALGFARNGYRTCGFDVDPSKVEAVAKGRSYIADVDSAELAGQVRSGRLTASARFDALAKLDAILICVPTPLRKTRDPDISYIVAALDEIAPRLRRGQIVVLEARRIRGRPRRSSCRGSRPRVSRSDGTSISPSRPSASILGTRSTGPRTLPRSSAASRRPARSSRRPSMPPRSRRSCRCPRREARR